MTPYKDDIFRELEAVLGNATTAQIERLLRDIATGKYPGTAQTRAGANDNRANVTDLVRPTAQRSVVPPDCAALRRAGSTS